MDAAATEFIHRVGIAGASLAVHDAAVFEVDTAGPSVLRRDDFDVGLYQAHMPAISNGSW